MFSPETKKEEHKKTHLLSALVS